VDAARGLGITDPHDFGRLQRGETISVNGSEVRPDQVMGEPRQGRKVVITGDTAPSDRIVEAAWGADVLVTEATFSDEERDRAEETRHQTATQAAEVARRAEVGMLVLTHLSARYFGRRSPEKRVTSSPRPWCPRTST